MVSSQYLPSSLSRETCFQLRQCIYIMESGVSQGIVLEVMDSNHGAMRHCPTVDNELPLDKLDDMMGNSAIGELQVHVSPARVGPYVGMEFETEEAVRVYYNEYAKSVGFSIRVSTTRRSKRDSTLIGRDFVCYKEGFRSKKYVSKRPNTREGCKAMIRVKKLDSNKWIVTRLIKDHNHELVGSGTVSLLRSHKHKIFLGALDEANNDHSSVDPYVGMEFESDPAARIFYYQYAKRLGFSIRVATTRRSKRDSTVIGRYFVCSKEGFCVKKYANRRPVMREGCKAMFRVKKLESEKWVVTQFEKDHNHELGFSGKGTYLRQSRLVSISNAAKSSVDCSGHSSEQARATSSPIENQWLYLLYRSREKWVRVFFQGAFCASVSTGQRNMSINSFFNVNEHTSLLVFVIQCEQAIDGWFEKQLEDDLKSSYMKPILKTNFPMEVQAAEVYTRIIFLEFQDQLIQSLQHVAELTNENGTISTFKVAEFGAENISHIVSFDAIEGCASCSCQMFEYAGILCRHVLRVFMVKNIMLLPSNCIWKRWTRSAMNGDATKDQGSHVHSNFQENRYLLYKDLCREAISYASEGALSLEIYNLAKRAIRKALEEVRAVKENAAALLQHSSPVVGSIHEENICEESQPADATSIRHTSHWSKFR
ncbi:FAR1-RELATED SEQUENCE 9 protein [Nymphaea thermarum]|nr:FAR1-RELATED SEQUENCE 9 protein [Nymphaea thermarum]